MTSKQRANSVPPKFASVEHCLDPGLNGDVTGLICVWAQRREEISMNEKVRHVLGFLGLVEDEYGDNTSSGSARLFGDQPSFESETEPSVSSSSHAARPF